MIMKLIQFLIKTVSLYNWHDQIKEKLPVYNGINIFSLLDTAEFHEFILNNIYEFFLIKKIIINLKPKKTYCKF